MTKSEPGITVRIDGGQLIFSYSTGASPHEEYCAQLGAVGQLFAGAPLSEISVERAINLTEELIIPILKDLPSSERLKIAGVRLEEVLGLMPTNDAGEYSIGTVEHLYKELEAHTSGSRWAWRHELPANQAALGLIVLREIMHHGGFESISLPSDGGEGK